MLKKYLQKGGNRVSIFLSSTPVSLDPRIEEGRSRRGKTDCKGESSKISKGKDENEKENEKEQGFFWSLLDSILFIVDGPYRVSCWR